MVKFMFFLPLFNMEQKKVEGLPRIKYFISCHGALNRSPYKWVSIVTPYINITTACYDNMVHPFQCIHKHLINYFMLSKPQALNYHEVVIPFMENYSLVSNTH